MPSTVIASTKYDPETATLRVIFLSGAIYDYLNVPPQVYGEMKNAFSKGTFLNERIKTSYEFKKVK
jgi:hypothetical protein